MAAATQNGAYCSSQQTNYIKVETNGTTKPTEKSTGIAEGKPNLVLRKRILFAVLALTLIVLVLAVTTTWLVVASKSNKETLNGRRVPVNKTMSENKEMVDCTHSHTTPQTNNVTSPLTPEDGPHSESELKLDRRFEVEAPTQEKESEEDSASDEVKHDETTKSSTKSDDSEENNESEEGNGTSEVTKSTTLQPIYNESFGEGSNPPTGDRLDEQDTKEFHKGNEKIESSETDTGSGDNEPSRPSKPCGFPWCDKANVVEDVNSEEEIVKVFSTDPIFSTTAGSVSPPPGVSDDDYVFNENGDFIPTGDRTGSSSEEDDGSGSGLSPID